MASAPAAVRTLLQQHKAQRRREQRAAFAARVLGAGDKVDQHERPEVAS